MGTVEPIHLIAEDTDLETLIALAVQARPELGAGSATIQVAQTQVRQERVRPWLPLLVAGYSSGLFGGGSNQVATEFGPLSSRSDAVVMAVWNVQNLGFGNYARVRRANAAVGAIADYEIALNQIRKEVGEAHAATQTAASQMALAKAALMTAEEGFRLGSRSDETRSRPPN